MDERARELLSEAADHVGRLRPGTVVGDHDLVRQSFLPRQRQQGQEKKGGAVIGGHDD
jgi:hypothetical protein